MGAMEPVFFRINAPEYDFGPNIISNVNVRQEDKSLSHAVVVHLRPAMLDGCSEGDEVNLVVLTQNGEVKIGGTVAPEAVRVRLLRAVESFKATHSDARTVIAIDVNVMSVMGHDCSG